MCVVRVIVNRVRASTPESRQPELIHELNQRGHAQIQKANIRYRP